MQVPYGGSAIQSGSRVYWRVQVWNAEDDDAGTSPIAFWERGLSSPSDWHAQWISIPEPPSGPRPATYLRKDFALTKPPVRVRAYATARGLYELFADGHRIGAEELAPGWTDYKKRIQYQTYDLTKELTVGRHAIGMVLGDGWYCGHVGPTPGNNYGTKPEGLVQLEITYKDGSKATIASDSSWKGGTGPIVSNDLLLGESYDATKDLPGWSTPAYDASKWSSVETAPLGPELLVGAFGPPVHVLTEIQPIKETEPAPGTYVFDLGQNMVGWARLHIHGARGTKVTLRFAEMLKPDGSIYTANLRGAKATDSYVLAGSGAEVFEPAFTFHGFRYVELTGCPSKPATNEVTGIVVGSDSPRTGLFACSNASINQLQHNIFWGQRGNYLSIPTDCPQRDERLGWMGDAEIFARTASFNNDVVPFHTKWTQDVVDAQSPEGGFSDVSPRIGDLSDGAPAWGDAGVIVPWTMYQCYGDKRLLADRYDAMKMWIKYIDSVNPDHLWINRSNNNFGDWLNVQDDTPRDVLATAFFAHSTDLLERTAEVLGRSQDAQGFGDLREEIKAAFVRNYVAADGTIKGDTQTDYVLALNFDLLPASLRSGATQRLVDHIQKDRKGHLSTGFVGSGLLNPTLTAVGRTDVAYQLLMTDTYPSWLYPIRQGATTIWERWDGWTKDKGFQDPGMNSFNHYSFGAVGQWLYSTVGGIDFDPRVPGYGHIRFHPVPGGGLTWAKASYLSIRGPIESSWKLAGGKFSLEVAVPPNCTADVYVPAKEADEVTEGGDVAGMDEGVSLDRMEDGCAVFRIGSGHYKFEVKQTGGVRG
jgi:alpha-L-rhamnosidase